jgi:glycosyltransferase involved in cell wall biosynthesis
VELTLKEIQLDGNGVNHSTLAVSQQRHPQAAPQEELFLSVLMRTQGKRPANLMEALTCLAAQTDSNFEVLLAVHTPEPEIIEAVDRLLRTFEPQFQERVRIFCITTGGRSAPLNVGLDTAAGSYVAFLDDDDLVTADWVEAFHEGARQCAGQIIRSVAADKSVKRPMDPRISAPYLTTTGLRLSYPFEFDPLEHLCDNRTPICSFATPTDVIRKAKIHFDEELTVLEDWFFLQQASLVAPVHDTGRVTSIYQRWESYEGSEVVVSRATWIADRSRIHAFLNNSALLLPKGTAARVVELRDEVNRARVDLRALQKVSQEEIRVRDELKIRAQQELSALKRHYDAPRYLLVDMANEQLKRRFPNVHAITKTVARALLRLLDGR